MARVVRDARLETRSARAKLGVRQEPHWRGITEGCHLGYYRGARGGKWVARYRLESGAYRKSTLGKADDTEDANGTTVLDYKQAQERARAWFGALEGGHPTSPYTVRDAVRDYLDAYAAGHTKGGGKALSDTAARAAAHIIPRLGNVEIDRLTAQQIREWQTELAKTPARLRTRPGTTQRYRTDADTAEAVRRRRASANRTTTILKAALNLAFQEGRARSDIAWRRVKPFRETDVAKVRYLSTEECARLLAAVPIEFGQLVHAALISGCRYGELIAMQATDFDATNGTVTVRTSKSGRGRHVVLGEEGIDLFRRLTQDKSGDALVFTRSGGKAWGRSHQHRPLREACARAAISPAVSFHVLRHTYASQLAVAGVPLQVIAANLGHADTRMTERHYAHLTPAFVANVIRAAMPQTRSAGLQPSGKLVPDPLVVRFCEAR